MGDQDPTLRQHQNEISIAELEPKIPAKAEKNDLVIEPPTREERVAPDLALCHAPFSLTLCSICTKTVDLARPLPFIKLFSNSAPSFDQCEMFGQCRYKIGRFFRLASAPDFIVASARSSWGLDVFAYFRLTSILQPIRKATRWSKRLSGVIT
jgi:hypothetical protein